MFSDTNGPLPPSWPYNYRYSLNYTDEHTGYALIYCLKKQSDTPSTLEHYVAAIAQPPRHLRSDNGGQYISDVFKATCIKLGIHQELTAPHHPQGNGKAERNWRTTVSTARCFLNTSGLSVGYWPFAFQTATYVRNRCYNPKLGMTTSA